VPVGGCKAIIAPHAGYSYSGPTAAWAYRCIDTTGIKRVFILGPSHHVYLDGCALSRFRAYDTPVGSLPLDLETIEELKKTGEFEDMSGQTDEDEHSIEMHLPYVRKVFEGKDITIVPVLVGSIRKDKEERFGAILAPYLAREDTICVVSTDFCHWGTRFDYTFYYPSPPPCTPLHLTRSGAQPASLQAHTICQSIIALDHEGMAALAHPSDSSASASAAGDNFAQYLRRTRNTVCGRHPIGVLMGALKYLEESQGVTSALKWVRYDQSSECRRIQDSSVSYASAYVVF